MFYHLTNLQSPIVGTDQVFIARLSNYRIGPPMRTWRKSRKAMIADGVFGVYAQGVSLEVKKLTGFDADSLSPYPLGASTVYLVYLFLRRMFHG